jgi:hypothetical protein
VRQSPALPQAARAARHDLGSQGAEATLEGGARKAIELPDGPETEPFEQTYRVDVEAQRGNRQCRQGALRIPWRDDHEGRGRRCRKPRYRMGAAEGVGEPRPYGEAETGKASDEIAEQRTLVRVGRVIGLTALGIGEKVGNTGDVDPQPVGAIEVPGRAIAPTPANEACETGAVLVRIRSQRDQRRQRRPRVGEPGAGPHAQRPRRFVDRRDLQAVRAARHQRQRSVHRHVIMPAMPPQAFDRPRRQPH